MSKISPPQPFVTLPLYRMTVNEYERIGGLLDDERIELIDGYLVRKLPKEPERCYSTHCVRDGLERLLPSGWTCHQYGPVRIPPYNEPEPDVSIVRGCDEDYRHRHAGPADVGLVVEVSMATLDLDRWPEARRLRDRRYTRSTGSSTWSSVRSRSTPSRGRARISRGWTTSPARPCPS